MFTFITSDVIALVPSTVTATVVLLQQFFFVRPNDVFHPGLSDSILFRRSTRIKARFLSRRNEFSEAQEPLVRWSFFSVSALNDVMKIYYRFENVTKEANDRKFLLGF